jgi:hypothetical protein
MAPSSPLAPPYCYGGSFYNTTSKSCEQCLVGKYKDTEDGDATLCAKCPEGRFGRRIVAQPSSSYCGSVHLVISVPVLAQLVVLHAPQVVMASSPAKPAQAAQHVALKA